MTNYVLLHGGGMGGWVWKHVAAPLRREGHEVWTPTFTGFGERHHLMSRDIGNETHVKDILGVLDCEDIQDAVLVAHSYAGVVAPGVVAGAGGRIARVVYVDAIVPFAGESVVEALGYMTQGQAEEMRQLLARGEGPIGAGVPDQVRAMAEVEPQRMSPERDHWVFSHLTDMPFSASVGRIAVGAETIRLRTDYLGVPHTMMHPMHARAASLGWSVHQLGGDRDHMVHVGDPDAVLEYLV